MLSCILYLFFDGCEAKMADCKGYASADKLN